MSIINASSVRTSVSHDVCEHASALDEWVDNRYHQLERKASFHGSISDYICNDDFRITQEIIDTPLIEQIGRVPSDKILLLNIKSESDVLLNGRFINSETFHFSSGKPIHAVAKSPIRAFIITLDKDFFFEHIATDSKELTTRGSFERFISPMQGSLIDFEKSVSNHFSRDYGVEQPDNGLQKVAGSIQEILLSSNDHTAHLLPPSTRAYIVEKSCELLFNNFADEEFGVLEMCNHLRISRRTLQYSFESIIGMSPSNYIRTVRLNIARKLLLLSPNERIQGAALDAGFSHLGRFSKYYHDFFGELPSETINRLSTRNSR